MLFKSIDHELTFVCATLLYGFALLNFVYLTVFTPEYTNIEAKINNTIIVSTKEAKVIPLLFFIFLPLFLTLSFKHFF